MIKVFNKKNDKINRWNYLKEMCPNLKHFDLVIWYKMLHKIIDEGNMHTFVTIEELIVPDTGAFTYVRPNYEWLCEFNRYLSAVEWSCIKIIWYPRQSEWFISWLFYKKTNIFLINRNVEKLCVAVTPLNFLSTRTTPKSSILVISQIHYLVICIFTYKDIMQRWKKQGWLMTFKTKTIVSW